jgi:hypothetical protein
MPNKSRAWVLIGFIGLIIIGLALIALPVLTPAQAPGAPPAVIPAVTNVAPGDVPYPDVIRVTVGNARAAQTLKQAVFVDVRAAEQYAQNRIPGAVSIPLSEFESRLNELNKDQWIITYCT